MTENIKMTFQSFGESPETISFEFTDKDNVQIIIQQGMSNESTSQLRIQEQSSSNKTIEDFWNTNKSFLMSKIYNLKIFANDILVTDIKKVTGARFQKTMFGKHIGAGFLKELIFLYNEG